MSVLAMPNCDIYEGKIGIRLVYTITHFLKETVATKFNVPGYQGTCMAAMIYHMGRFTKRIENWML